MLYDKKIASTHKLYLVVILKQKKCEKMSRISLYKME